MLTKEDKRGLKYGLIYGFIFFLLIIGAGLFDKLIGKIIFSFSLVGVIFISIFDLKLNQEDK